MITNIQQFKLDLRHFKKVVVPQTHMRYCVMIAMNLHRLIVTHNSLMERHPVDTGWARANWAFFVGTVPPREPIGTRPPEGTRIDVVQNGAVELARVQPFPLIWIYNNVPYIEVLEDGHSTKAPSGMVEGALNDIQLYINSL